ncbi:MAG: thiolase family protein [Acidilobaceae archaeon]
MREVYIVDGVRTPIGKFGKSLKNYKASDLASFVIRKLLNRTNLDPFSIDFVVMGHVIRAGTGMNTAKQAALRAGLSPNVAASNVDMVCASGIKAIITASLHIAVGDYDIAIAGGMESMSQAPLLLPASHRWGVRHLVLDRGLGSILDSMVYDGLTDVLNAALMGEEADNVAHRYGATKEELDWIGYESHRRASWAWTHGLFKKHVEAIVDNGNVVLEKDEGVRYDLKLEEAYASKPIFSPEGLHTPISSSQLSDGAAAVILASNEAVKKFRLEPIARIVGYSYVGIEPRDFPVAPVYAIRKLLSKIGWSIDKVDFWENNEAFAVNSFLINKLLGIPYDALNVYGGAIALGHPLGASGARITVDLLNVLETRNGIRGVVSICHGLGGAAALAIELL